MYEIELDALQNEGKRNRPGSHSSEAPRQGELLPSPARRERPAYSWNDVTNNNGLPQRLHKRLKQDVSVTEKVTVQHASTATSTQPQLHQPIVQSKISKFHSEMASLQMSLCITCRERFPGLTVRMTQSDTECFCVVFGTNTVLKLTHH